MKSEDTELIIKALKKIGDNLSLIATILAIQLVIIIGILAYALLYMPTTIP